MFKNYFLLQNTNESVLTYLLEREVRAATFQVRNVKIAPKTRKNVGGEAKGVPFQVPVDKFHWCNFPTVLAYFAQNLPF